jgi:NAD(P)-dependent dehydrogenase (short-subunit alcohol dehydrogenase family)
MNPAPAVSIEGKRILLVGATGVLGRTFAQHFAQHTQQLVLADRPESDVLKLAEELKVYGVEIDLCDETSVVDAVASAARTLGGLDGVVNNAAMTSEGLMKLGDAFAPFEDYSVELWRKTLDVNLTGPFLVAREAGRIMRAAGKGSLVNVSSVYGIVAPDNRIYDDQPFKSFAAYSASKAGILGLTRWLASWWGPHGVRCNSVTPGGVFNGHNDRFVEAYATRTPLHRMAHREELVGIMIYLLSDASSYCTGQNYVVDGGFSAW